MCLGLPGQIVRFIDSNVVVCDFWGQRREVRLDLIEDDLTIGDFVLDHEGYAVRRIEDEQIADTLLLYETILTEAGDDPLGIRAVDH
jgi:hydrogenase expression/formation protein HypC